MSIIRTLVIMACVLLLSASVAFSLVLERDQYGNPTVMELTDRNGNKRVYTVGSNATVEHHVVPDNYVHVVGSTTGRATANDTTGMNMGIAVMIIGVVALLLILKKKREKHLDSRSKQNILTKTYHHR